MHSSKRLYEQPRAHRLDFANRCALSDCCGAPIIQGGICFDCREHCEEETFDVRPARFVRTASAHANQRALANVERPRVSYYDEETGGAFDRVSVRTFSD